MTAIKEDQKEGSNNVADLLNANYRPEYFSIENKITQETETIACLSKLTERVKALKEGQLNDEHANFLLTSALPKITKAALKHRFMDDDISFKVNEFHKLVLEIIAIHIEKLVTPTVITSLLTTAIQLFDNDNYFYLCRGRAVEDVDISEAYAQYPHANRWPSYFIVDNVNLFGKKGGFANLMKYMRSDATRCPLPIITKILEFFWTIQNSGYFPFMRSRTYIQEIQEIVSTYLLSLSNEELKNVKKDDYEGLMKYFAKLLDAIYSWRQGGEILEKLQLEVALKCFVSPIFDKRIYGLGYISEMISMVKAAEKERESSLHTITYHGVGQQPKEAKWVDARYLVTWLVTNKIIDILFGKSAQHQLLKRSADVVSFLAKHDSLSQENIDLIWKCATTVHEAFQGIVFKMIGDISGDLQPSHIVHIVSYIETIPKNSLTLEHINLIADFSKSCKDSTQRLQMVELLWVLSHDDNSAIPGEVVAQAVSCLLETVKTTGFKSFRHSFILKALDAIKQNNSVAYSYDIIMAIISSFSNKPNSVMHMSDERENRMMVIARYHNEHHFIDLFFQELIKFKANAIENAKNYAQSGYDLNQVPLAGRLAYINEVKARLNYLKFVLEHHEEVLPYNNYEILWDNFIINCITHAERDECFKWFLEARRGASNCYPAIDDDNISKLYVHRFLSLDPTQFSTLAFKCFQKYFCDALIREKKLQWRDNKEEDFEIIDHTANLRGLPFFVDIILNCQENEVVKEAMDFYIKVYHRLDEQHSRQHTKNTLREDFVRQCLTQIEKASQMYQTNMEESERKIVRCLTLLSIYATSVEREAGVRTRSHGRSTRGAPLTLNIINDVPASEAPESFQVEAHQNETIEELKHKIKAMLPKFQGVVEELFLAFNRTQLQDENKSLQELQINNKDTLHVHALQQIPKGMETVNRSRIKKDQQKTSRPAPPDADEKAQQLSEIYHISKAAATVALKKADWDVGNAALFLSDDTQKSEILQEAEKSDSSSSKKDTFVDTTEAQHLPSYILANTESYFEQLFTLLNYGNDIISQKVWELILTIPTSHIMQEKLHNSSNATSDEWNQLFDPKSSFKLLYSLQIVDSIIFPIDHAVDMNIRCQWCIDFLRRGGFQHIFSILTTQPWFSRKLTSSQGEGTIDEPSQQQKNCLALILKIFDYFLQSLLSPDIEVDDLTKQIRLNLKNENVPLLLSKIDFKLLLEKVMKIIWDSATKVNPDREDQEVVTYSVRLMSVCLIRDTTSLLPYFYTYPHLEDFINTILIKCKQSSIRSVAGEGLYRLCTIPLNDVPITMDHPHSYFLSYLLNNIPSHLILDPSEWSSYGQYFGLLDKLIRDACIGKFGSTSQFQDLLVEFIKRIKSRPIVETRHSELVDEILVGMLNISTTIVKNIPKYRPELGTTFNMLEELYHNCLFALKAGPSAHSPPKCKTKTSRIAAFALLVEICKEPSNLMKVLQLLGSNHNGSLKLNTWEYQPGTDDKAVIGYVGLKNLGNTCYMNSLLQQFFMLPALRYGILNIEEDVEKKDSLILQLQYIFSFLQESEKLAYEPVGFTQAYKDWDGKPTNVHLQQDVDEFFNFLCQRLEAQLKNTPHAKVLSSVFGGKISNEIRSVDKEFPYYSETEEDFYTISLDIKGKTNIEQALDAYVKADKLEGDNAYYCDKYDRKVDATKRCCIKKLSNTLILHLKRFEFDFTTFKKVKLNDYIEFPEFLNIKPWTKEGLAADEIEQTETYPDSYYKYELRGVLVHSGGADAGHYYSYIKERIPSSGNERKWIEFNDKNVLSFDSKDLPTECFGGTQPVTHWDNNTRQYVRRIYDRVRNAYMLFYDRVEPEPGTLITAKSAQELTSQLQELAIESKRETINGLPIQIYNRVWSENAEFLKDRALFDPSYFDFMLNISKLISFQPVLDYSIDPNDIANDPTFQAIKLATHFVLDNLSHAKEADPIFRPWIDHLKSLYEKHVPACKWLVQYIIESNLPKDLLLDCTNEKIRIGIAELIVQICKVLGPYEYPHYLDMEIITKPVLSKDRAALGLEPRLEEVKQAKSYSVRLMDNILSILEDSRPYWRRFKQYFLVIRDFALIGHHERAYLFSRGLCALYVDYFMGRPKKGQVRRVSVMDRFNLPDLTEFVSTLSVLIRGCETGSLKDKGIPPTSLTPLLIMPTRERKEVIDRHFLSNMLEMDYNSTAAIEIMVHICWEDITQSKWILDILLSEISRTYVSEKLPIFQTLLLPILQMNDSLQNTRIIIALSPFAVNGSAKGIIALIHDVHNSSPKFAYTLVKYLMQLASTVPAVASYLEKQKKEMSWIEQFLEAKVNAQERENNQTTQHHHSSRRDAMAMGLGSDTDTDNGEDMDSDREMMMGYGPHPERKHHKSDNNPNGWRRDSLFLTYNSVKNFLANFKDDEPNADRERELMEEIDVLKRDMFKLKEALEYYRRKSPASVKVPAFMTTPQWENEAQSMNWSKFDDDADTEEDEAHSVIEQPGRTSMETEPTSSANPDAEMKAKQLQEFFPNISIATAMVALKKADYDLEQAAGYLFDEDQLMEFVRQAENEQNV